MMHLMAKNQEAQPLQVAILPKIGVAEGRLLVLRDDFLAIIGVEA